MIVDGRGSERKGYAIFNRRPAIFRFARDLLSNSVLNRIATLRFLLILTLGKGCAQRLNFMDMTICIRLTD